MNRGLYNIVMYWAMFVSLMGCQEYKIEEIKEVVTPGPLVFNTEKPDRDFPFHKQLPVPDGPYDLGDPLYPDIELSFLQYDFGTRELSSPPLTVPLEIKNVGDYHLTIWSIGSNCTSLSYTHTGLSNTSILPGYSETMVIQYNPTTYGDDACYFNIESDDPDEPLVSVLVTARGAIPDLEVRPLSLTFGSIDLVSTPSRTMTVSLENVGDGLVNITNISEAKKSPDISVSSYPTMSLVPGQQTTLDIMYSPSDYGPDLEEITITSNDPYKANQVIVTEGETATPLISTLTTLDYGIVEVGSSNTQIIEIHNKGTGTLSLTGAYFQTTNIPFAIISSYTGDISPGSFVEIEVRYSPTDYTPDVGQLDVMSNDPSQPVVTISLTGEPGIPQIGISPVQIDYGDTQVGYPSTETVTVSNLGTGTLTLNNISLLAATQYKIIHTSAYSLPPNTQATIELEYTPIAYGNDADVLSVSSNDPLTPVVAISLKGRGSAPQIEISPDPYDFGYEYLECASEAIFDIKNVGDIDLVVTNIEYFTSFPNYFSIDHDHPVNGAFPWTITPGSFNSVYIEYSPSDITSDSSFIKVHSNDPTSPIAYAYQTGEGEYYSSVMDTFTQSNVHESDILFVIDNSCSMGSWQTHVATNFDSFMTVFQNSGVDYHIAFITTDSPTFIGPIIDPQNPDPLAEVQSQVQVGIYGSGYEQGLDQAYWATQPGGDAAPGSLFERPAAKLSIIFVSDEPDYSSTFYNKLDYVPHLSSTRVNPNNVVSHAIAGDYPSGCSYNSRWASHGKGYYDVVGAMNGTFLSICDSDWGIKMETLAKDSIIRSSFALSGVPVRNTIEVYVNGAANTNWFYDSLNNSVDFDPLHIPPVNSNIDISYNIYGGCP